MQTLIMNFFLTILMLVLSLDCSQKSATSYTSLDDCQQSYLRIQLEQAEFKFQKLAEKRVSLQEVQQERQQEEKLEEELRKGLESKQTDPQEIEQTQELEALERAGVFGPEKAIEAYKIKRQSILSLDCSLLSGLSDRSFDNGRRSYLPIQLEQAEFKWQKYAEKSVSLQERQEERQREEELEEELRRKLESKQTDLEDVEQYQELEALERAGVFGLEKAIEAYKIKRQEEARQAERLIAHWQNLVNKEYQRRK